MGELLVDQVEAARFLRILVAFYQQDVKDKELTLVLWADALGDLPRSEVDKAIKVHCRESRFFPNPAQIREIVVSEMIGMPTPDEAWALVVDQIREVGMYSAPDLSRELREAVRVAGGWRYLGNGPEDKVRDSFIWAYKGLIERKRREVTLEAIEAPEGNQRVAVGSGE
jgi:hypothetical protein